MKKEVADGDSVPAGTVLMRLEGHARAMLAAERSAVMAAASTTTTEVELLEEAAERDSRVRALRDAVSEAEASPRASLAAARDCRSRGAGCITSIVSLAVGYISAARAHEARDGLDRASCIDTEVSGDARARVFVRDVAASRLRFSLHQLFRERAAPWGKGQQDPVKTRDEWDRTAAAVMATKRS